MYKRIGRHRSKKVNNNIQKTKNQKEKHPQTNKNKHIFKKLLHAHYGQRKHDKGKKSRRLTHNKSNRFLQNLRRSPARGMAARPRHPVRERPQRPPPKRPTIKQFSKNFKARQRRSLNHLYKRAKAFFYKKKVWRFLRAKQQGRVASDPAAYDDAQEPHQNNKSVIQYLGLRRNIYLASLNCRVLESQSGAPTLKI